MSFQLLYVTDLMVNSILRVFDGGLNFYWSVIEYMGNKFILNSV